MPHEVDLMSDEQRQLSHSQQKYLKSQQSALQGSQQISNDTTSIPVSRVCFNQNGSKETIKAPR